MEADRRREVVKATLEALRHTVGRDEHMPLLKTTAMPCTLSDCPKADVLTSSEQPHPVGVT